MRNTKDCTLQEFVALAWQPLLRALRRWWWRRAEDHFLICADVEIARAQEAQLNAAYYQKRAVMARSEHG